MRILSILILGCLNLTLLAQQKPPFVRNELPCRNKNYRYKVAFGEGATSELAMKACHQNFFGKLPGFTEVEQRCMTEIMSKMESGTSTYLDKFECVGGTKTMSKYVTEMLDSYEENKKGQYRVYGLYAFTDNKASFSNFERVDYTDNYGGGAIWRSALLPGWGQRYKGDSQFKALSFFVGTVAPIVFSLYAANQFNTFNTKSQSRAYSLSQRRNFADQANQWQNFQIIGLSVGIGIYGFNLVDAITKPGKLKYKCR